jgi:hypothetical protein
MGDPNAFYPVGGPAAHAASHRSNGGDPLSTVIHLPVTLTDAATINTDAASATHFRVTLGGNRTLANPTNMVDGQRMTWEVIQDGSGSRLLSYGSKFTFGTDVPSPTLSTTAGTRDFITGIYNASADRVYVVGFARGF